MSIFYISRDDYSYVNKIGLTRQKNICKANGFLCVTFVTWCTEYARDVFQIRWDEVATRLTPTSALR